VFELLKPLGDRIIIKPTAAEEVTKGGIVLPDTAKEKPREGEVIAVGPGKVQDNGTKVPMDIKVGDKVIYSRYGGTEVKVGADEYVILRQDDVLAVSE
jgi:chaperonin GroES